MAGNVMKRMFAGIFAGLLATIIGALGIILASSGILSTAEYLKPWQQAYSTRFEDPRIQLVAHGLLAANSHNMQPWNVRLDPEDPLAFSLYADPDRLTPGVDPYARQTMITQGAFLEYVKIAGEELGYQAGITLFPDGPLDEETLPESMRNKAVARITLKRIEARVNTLYDPMFFADTDRGPYQAVAPTPEQVQQLQDVSADGELTVMVFLRDEDRAELGAFAMEGAQIESGIHRVLEESGAIFRANERQKNQYRYGFSLEGQGMEGLRKHIMQGLITLFPSLNNEKASSDLFLKSTRTAVENTPAYAMIITKTNTREQQVRAGMAYSRFVLTAHSVGLVVQPLSQVLQEYPEMEEQYRQIHAEFAPDGGTIQMFFRLGKPHKEAPLSMRRDVMELIERD